MEKITAIILGIIQGLTEFLPISSSGHVEIIRVLIDSNSIENNNLLFSTVIPRYSSGSVFRTYILCCSG